MHNLSAVNRGSEYSEEDWEFILAVRKWQHEHRTKFPTFSEVLGIAKGIGYARRQPPAAKCPNCKCPGCRPRRGLGDIGKAARLVSEDYD